MNNIEFFTTDHPDCEEGEVYVCLMSSKNFDDLPFKSKRAGKHHRTRVPFGYENGAAGTWKATVCKCLVCGREKYTGPCLWCVQAYRRKPPDSEQSNDRFLDALKNLKKSLDILGAAAAKTADNLEALLNSEGARTALGLLENGHTPGEILEFSDNWKDHEFQRPDPWVKTLLGKIYFVKLPSLFEMNELLKGR